MSAATFVPDAAVFDAGCRRCPRLAEHLDGIRRDYPRYYARPVPPFGAAHPRLLIVGLAPGLHGANATGRPFTGDYAGILLYKTLYINGFSNQPEAVSPNDGLQLQGCRITNAVKCLPPQNKPVGREIASCNGFLAAELAGLPARAVILALGRIAHDAVLKALKLRAAEYAFAHAACHSLPGGGWLLDSYHCSRYNTQTRRLTEEMFQSVVAEARRLVDATG